VIPGENDLKRDLGTRQHSSSCQVLVCSEWWKTQFAWKYQQSACCWRGDSPRQIEGWAVFAEIETLPLSLWKELPQSETDSAEAPTNRWKPWKLTEPEDSCKLQSGVWKI
jgi:hypothetical protein